MLDFVAEELVSQFEVRARLEDRGVEARELALVAALQVRDLVELRLRVGYELSEIRLVLHHFSADLVIEFEFGVIPPFIIRGDSLLHPGPNRFDVRHIR